MADTTNETPITQRKRRTPRPIRLDMTPLVDLAFLLLSFFVITTTLRHEQVMTLMFPRGGPQPRVNNALTFLLAHRNECFAYRGAFDAHTTHLQRLDAQQLELLLSEASAQPELMCLVKPHRTAKYAAVIDLLDELSRHGIERFSVQDSLAEAERDMLERKLAVLGH